MSWGDFQKAICIGYLYDNNLEERFQNKIQMYDKLVTMLLSYNFSVTKGFF